MKEGRALLPGTDKRPADIFIPHWAGGLDAALDVTVTHPLQDATRAGAATTAGFALNKAYDRKVAAVGELCQQQGIAFIPIVAESLGGWHPSAVEQATQGQSLPLKAGPHRVRPKGPINATQGRTQPHRVRLHRADHCHSEEDPTGSDHTGSDHTGSDHTGPGQTGPGQTGPIIATQGRTIQGHTTQSQAKQGQA